MKKYFKNTLGKKLAAFYLVLFAVTFYFMATLGKDYIEEKVIVEAENQLRSAGMTLLTGHINKQNYNKSSIRALQTQMEMAAETSEYRILVVADDGDIVLDTSHPTKTYNVYLGDTSFLEKEITRNFTIPGYFEQPSLCITLPMQENLYINGHLVITQANSYLQLRADYYYNILGAAFYLVMLLLGICFIALYFFNFRPLRKLRNGVKDFSISHENKPILIRSNDEYGELADTLNIIGAELSKFDEYQRKFISNISHDFRSPLTNIQGYVQAMADGIIPPENQEKYLNIILFETERLTKLTSNLLDMNNFDKNNIFLEITDFDIQDAIRKTAEALEGSATKREITFDMNFSPTDSLFVSGDKDKIQQVLHNLMDNAIKFSHSHSTVSVKTRKKGDKIFVSVKDTGIGIPKDDINKIWDRFYKTDLSRGKDKLGTGLGLSICKEIINAHRQTIDVVSTEGVGSEFVFTLPKA